MVSEEELRKKLWAAGRLAARITRDGSLNFDSQAAADYETAGFQGGMYPVVSGPDGIDAGLVCRSNIGLVMAFRGTTRTFEDWKNDFGGSFTPFPGHGRVHTGFINSVRSVEAPLIRRAVLLYPSQQPGGLYLTGHSKGGAMASLMAAELDRLRPEGLPLPKVVTFGAPRVGDSRFTETYPCEHTRYESFRDIVPHLPITPQESALLTVVMENVTDWFSVFTQGDLCQYAPLGRLKDICPPGISVPCDIPGISGETLNSFYYVVTQLILKGRFSELGKYHMDDYPG